MFNLKMPQSIFAHADGFLKAASKLHGDPPGDAFAALVINSAFACELYLKCLIHLETGQLFKDEHDLKKLFSKLSAGTQASIETKFDAAFKLPDYDLSKVPEHMRESAEQAIAMQPKNLREALKAGGSAFVRWRYLYEDETGKTSDIYSLFSRPGILRIEILTRKPEWALFRMTMQKFGDSRPTSPAPKKQGPDGSIG
jgi:hypothetical protein